MDFQNAQKIFKDYLTEYDLEDGPIKLKIRHTYEVVFKSEHIAKELQLDQENIEIAKKIALFHDIGRFEQVKQTRAFADNKSFDHAQYGVTILEKSNVLEKITENQEEQEIIKKAIYYHNKYKVGENLTPLQLLHTQIVRDSDKLDNFRVTEEEKVQDIFPAIEDTEAICYDSVSPKVYQDFLNHQCIKIEDRKTQLDFMVCILAFIFDLNYATSLQYIKDKNYIDALIDKIEYKKEETRDKMEKIRTCAKLYVEDKIKEK